MLNKKDLKALVLKISQMDRADLILAAQSVHEIDNKARPFVQKAIDLRMETFNLEIAIVVEGEFDGD